MYMYNTVSHVQNNTNTHVISINEPRGPGALNIIVSSKLIVNSMIVIRKVPAVRMYLLLLHIHQFFFGGFFFENPLSPLLIVRYDGIIKDLASSIHLYFI